jgi:hypothetical protein
MVKTRTVQYVKLLRAVARYISRNRATMFTFLSEDQQACVSAVASSVDACLESFGPRTVI